MNEQHWNFLLNTLTAGQEESPEHTDYLNNSINYMISRNIDMKGKDLLDVGCNDDRLKGRIQSTWYGIDFKESALYPKDDLHELQFEDKMFDIIFCSHVLEHTLAPIICLYEMKRVMKDDGEMIIDLPIFPGFMYDGHNYIMNEQSWMHLFKRVGLKLIDKITANNNTTLFRLQKEK